MFCFATGSMPHLEQVNCFGILFHVNINKVASGVHGFLHGHQCLPGIGSSAISIVELSLLTTHNTGWPAGMV